MPLLVCPNDNASMQTVNRSGVEFDFCPTCRGVWLDRGELEKLMSAERAALEADLPPPPSAPAPAPRGGFAPPPRRQPHDDPRYARPDDRYDDRRRYRDDDDDDDDRYRQRKRRGFSLLDIFD